MPAQVASVSVTVREAFEQGLRAALEVLSVDLPDMAPVMVPVEAPPQPTRHAKRDPVAPVVAVQPPVESAVAAVPHAAGRDAAPPGRGSGHEPPVPRAEPQPAPPAAPVPPAGRPPSRPPASIRQAFLEGHASVQPQREAPRAVARPVSPRQPLRQAPQEPPPARPPSRPQAQRSVPPPPVLAPARVDVPRADAAMRPAAREPGTEGIQRRENTGDGLPGDPLQPARERLDAHLATLTAAQQLAKRS